MTEKNKVDVIIDGRNFTVVGEGSEEYVKGLAQYVDEKIRDISSKNNKLSNSMAATLAAFNIADELYRTSEEFKDLKIKSKGPMEQYDNLVKLLEDAEKKINKLEKEANYYKDELLETKKKNEELNKKIEKKESTLELKEKELEESQDMIKKLQDKIFENQMELIETKKELEESLRTYGQEKRILSQGGNLNR